MRVMERWRRLKIYQREVAVQRRLPDRIRCDGKHAIAIQVCMKKAAAVAGNSPPCSTYGLNDFFGA